MKFKLFLVTLISLFISTQSFANTLVCQEENDETKVLEILFKGESDVQEISISYKELLGSKSYNYDLKRAYLVYDYLEEGDDYENNVGHFAYVVFDEYDLEIELVDLQLYLSEQPYYVMTYFYKENEFSDYLNFYCEN